MIQHKIFFKIKQIWNIYLILAKKNKINRFFVLLLKLISLKINVINILLKDEKMKYDEWTNFVINKTI